MLCTPAVTLRRESYRVFALNPRATTPARLPDTRHAMVFVLHQHR